MGSDQHGGRGARLDRAARRRIGRHLGLAYRLLVGEPLPDGYIDPLLALRRQERELGRSP